MEIRIGPSRIHGNGVFARRRFRPGDIVEVCPVLVIPETAIEIDGELDGLTYAWDEGHCAIALGYGSFYNHAKWPKAEAVLDEDARAITIMAITEINTGDEITISYLPDDADLWF